MNKTFSYGLLKRSYDAEDDYVHRFIFGLGNIRSCVYRDTESRNAYDKSFSPVMQSLTEMRIAKVKCLELIERHTKDIAERRDGVFSGNQITVTYPIDDELNLLFKDFFIRGIMVTRALNKHTEFLGCNTSFLFTDQEKKFKKGIESFPLAPDDKRFEYLMKFANDHKQTWYKVFSDMRTSMEHLGWSLDDIKYQLDRDMNVYPIFPKASGHEIRYIFDTCWNNIVHLCEEITVFALSLKLDDDKVIVRIPETEREKHNKARYMVSHITMPGVPLGCG
jgi:hypothetical protein